MVCSHDPFFSADKESSIWCQNDHARFVGVFHLSRRVSDENRACFISTRFFIHVPFFGTKKNRILKNGSCEQDLTNNWESLQT